MAAAAAAAAGKNAVIKGSFPFVMQTYDRPTLTLLPLSLFVCLSLCLSLSLSFASGKEEEAVCRSVEWNVERTKLAVCTLRGNNRRTRASQQTSHHSLPFTCTEARRPSEIVILHYLLPGQWSPHIHGFPSYRSVRSPSCCRSC